MFSVKPLYLHDITVHADCGVLQYSSTFHMPCNKFCGTYWNSPSLISRITMFQVYPQKKNMQNFHGSINGSFRDTSFLAQSMDVTFFLLNSQLGWMSWRVSDVSKLSHWCPFLSVMDLLLCHFFVQLWNI